MSVQITTSTLTATALTGASLNTAGGETDSISVTGTGALRLTSQGAVVLQNLTATNGAITVTAAGTITATRVVSSAGTSSGITLTADIGNLVLNAITATSVTLKATTGAITQTTGSLITTTALTATAATGASLTTAGGDTDTISVTDAGALNLTSQGAVVLKNLTAANGAINVTAAGTITATRVVSTAGTNSQITLTASSGDLSLKEITASSVTLVATAGAITQVQGALIRTGTLTATALNGVSLETYGGATDTITVTGAGALNLTSRGSVVLQNLTTTDGAITVTAAGTIYTTSTAVISAALVASSPSANSQITLTSSGGNLQVNAITANSVTLVTRAGYISKTLSSLINTTTLTATAVTGVDLKTAGGETDSISVTGTGGLKLTSTGAVVLQNLTTANGAITVTAAGTITATRVDSSAGANSLITLTASSGDLSLNAITATSVTLKAPAGAISQTAGLITTTSVTATAVTGASLITAGGETDTITVTGAGALNLTSRGAVVLKNLTAANGAINVTATGTITATRVVSTTDTAGKNVTLVNKADSGDVLVGTVSAGYQYGAIFIKTPGNILKDTVSTTYNLSAAQAVVIVGSTVIPDANLTQHIRNNLENITPSLNSIGITTGGSLTLAVSGTASTGKLLANGFSGTSAQLAPTSFRWSINNNILPVTGFTPLTQSWADLQALGVYNYGSYTISVRAYYGSGSDVWSETTSTLTVTDVQSVISNLAATEITIGGYTQLTGEILQIGALPDYINEQNYTLTVDWGDNSSSSYQLDQGVVVFNKGHQYLTLPTSNITVTVADSIGTISDNALTTVVINDVVPVVNNLAATDIKLGGYTQLTGMILQIDALPDYLNQQNYTLTVDWGDNSSSSYELDQGVGVFNEGHQYLTLPTTDITVTVKDSIGTTSDIAMTTVTIIEAVPGAPTFVSINDVVPVVNNLAATDIIIGGYTQLTGNILQIGALPDYINQQNYMLTVDWGDNSSSSYVLDQGVCVFNEGHQYLTLPTMGINVTVTDSIGTTSDIAMTTVTIFEVFPETPSFF